MIIVGSEEPVGIQLENGELLPENSFPYRILILEDDARLRELGKLLLESQAYEVLTAGDGFEGLLALKRALPDIIISDLSMPHMNGFEFLSVVRRRFPIIPVIVISGEFSGTTVPESVLADAFFAKGHYKAEGLFQKIMELLQELPARPRIGKPDKAAVWVKRDNGIVAVTCTDCLRTFPVLNPITGINTVECEFCSCTIRFEIIDHIVE
ncbi:MAG: response regulator [Acidobacteriales bacterium]|nr:response regulator [Terriglobales bacterium]